MIPKLIYITCVAGVTVGIVRALLNWNNKRNAMFSLAREYYGNRARWSAALVILFSLGGIGTYVAYGFPLPVLPSIKVELPAIKVGLPAPGIFMLAVGIGVTLLVIVLVAILPGRVRRYVNIESAPNVMVNLLVEVIAAIIAGLILAHIFGIRQ